MAEWRYTSNTSLAEVDVDKIVDSRSHGVARERRQEDQRNDSIIKVIVRLQLKEHKSASMDIESRLVAVHMEAKPVVTL